MLRCTDRDHGDSNNDSYSINDYGEDDTSGNLYNEGNSDDDDLKKGC